MKKEWVAVLLLLGVPLVLRAMKPKTATWAAIVPSPEIRVDSLGDGHFEASRSGHVHQGVDLIVSPGQTVSAPISGKITRIAYPYSGEWQWKGVEMEGDGEWSGFNIKIFYVDPFSNLIGARIERGFPIGTAQAISQKYGPAMKDHVHVELRRGGKVVNPTSYLIP